MESKAILGQAELLPAGKEPKGKKLVWPGFALWDTANVPDFDRILEVFVMEFTPISPILPIVDTTGAQQARGTESAGSSLFATVFQSAIDNVRETEDTIAKQEYLLSTGQLDNPAQLMLDLYKGQVSMSVLVQLREKALNAYSELSRMSL